MLVMYIEEYATNICRSTSACRIQVCAVATDTPDQPARRCGSAGASVTRPHRPAAGGCRAHSVPVRAESVGHQRCDLTRTTTSATSICARQSHTGHPSAVASQAEGASSILVTRSIWSPRSTAWGLRIGERFQGFAGSSGPGITSPEGCARAKRSRAEGVRTSRGEHRARSRMRLRLRLRGRTTVGAKEPGALVPELAPTDTCRAMEAKSRAQRATCWEARNSSACGSRPPGPLAVTAATCLS